MERYKFFTRVRKSGETIAMFMSELRRLAKTCGFGDSLNVMLRDRLVCGVNDNSIQRRLLQEKRMTLERAMEIALGMETAESLEHAGNADAAASGTHRRSTQGFNSSTPKVLKKASAASSCCFRCGKRTHEPSCCPFRTKDCFYCKKKGHTQLVCRSRLAAVDKSRGKAQQRVKQLESLTACLGRNR